MKIGVFNHARNGVRVSQYSKFILLGALAFLCLAIVSLCVFSNLNALATDNIAFANSSDGIVEDNLLFDSSFSSWGYSSVESFNSSSPVKFRDNWFMNNNNPAVYYVNDSTGFHISYNGSGYFNLYQDIYDNLYNKILTISCRINGVVKSYTFTTPSSVPNSNTSFYSSNTGFYNRFVVYNTEGRFGFYFTSSGSFENIVLDWCKLEIGSSFTGYVPKTYVHYGYEDGYNDGYVSGSKNVGFNFLGSLLTIGSLNEFTFDNKTYFGSAEESDSINIDGVRYQGNYYLTGGENYYLGFVVDYIFNTKIRINTILFGNDSRWNEVGFNLMFCNLNDGTSFTLTRSDTQYYSILNTLRVGGDSTYGNMYAVQFEYTFPDNADYRLIFVPINHNITVDGSDFIDSSSMLIWDNTYIFGISESGISSDNINILLQDAYDNGVIYGRQEGYNSGYEIARVKFYNEGYEDGLDGNSFTFLSLFSSVIDAPIKAFNGLFDFNLLGVNMRSFLLSILTLAIALFVWKIIVKGG